MRQGFFLTIMFTQRLWFSVRINRSVHRRPQWRITVVGMALKREFFYEKPDDSATMGPNYFRLVDD